MDLAIAIPLVVLLLPVMVGIAIAILITMGRPVIFKQVRPGLQGRPFTMYKFRTMTDARDHEGKLLPDAERLTKLGRFLRSTSLDELPEVINVIKGDMSLVGTRLMLMTFMLLISVDQARSNLDSSGYK